jgi:hypothetical protein
MTSFITTTCATFWELIDPPDGSPAYAGQAYDYLKGKMGTVGRYLKRPDSSIIVYYFSGDPVAGTGDLPANFPLGEFRPQCAYPKVNSGPFTLAKGDTQEVVAAVAISQGSDRLESVTMLKRNVEYVHDSFASGTGALPERYLSVYPFRIDYDSTLVGEKGDTAGVVLHNVGLDTLHISSVEPHSIRNFRVSGPSTPFDLATGESALFSVTFWPEDHGLITDSIVIQSNDSTYPVRSIPLQGIAYTMFPAEGGLMYASSSTLYSLNPASPSPVPIGPVFGSPGGLTVRHATGQLYGVGAYSSSRTKLFKICAQNADVVYVCTIPLGNLRAIAFNAGDTLYAGTGGTTWPGRLYRVDIASGDTALVGSSPGVGYSGFAFSPTDGKLWASSLPGLPLGARRDRILTVNTDNGASTLVGYVGDSLQIRSLAFGPDGILYGLQNLVGGEQRLVQIDTTDAHGTVIDTLGTLGLQGLAMRTDIATGVEVDEVYVPIEYALSQNYPNPFNPGTTIEFALPHAGFVMLRVYNVLGERVATLIEGDHATGTFKATWDALGMPSGVYFYRLTVGEYVQTKKMILIK